MLEVLHRHPNLIVLQTFSKAWGMAGLRLGMAFASPEIAALFGRVKYPYNVNGPTQAEVMRRIEMGAASCIKEICEQRQMLAEALPNVPCIKKVFPSDANFFLVKVNDPDKVYAYLMKHGVIVRNRHRVFGCSGCLRLTIGTPEENKRLLKLLNEYK